jgi:hypothetical protein
MAEDIKTAAEIVAGHSDCGWTVEELLQDPGHFDRESFDVHEVAVFDA